MNNDDHESRIINLELDAAERSKFHQELATLRAENADLRLRVEHQERMQATMLQAMGQYVEAVKNTPGAHQAQRVEGMLTHYSQVATRQRTVEERAVELTALMLNRMTEIETRMDNLEAAQSSKPQE